jgi:hypothetical protein
MCFVKNNIMKRFSSDEANSATVEFILLLLLLVAILFTILDFGMYFNNRAVIANSAQNGARLAAIFGGSTETSISKQYGSKNGNGNRALNMSQRCIGVANNALACIVLEDLLDTKGIVNTQIKSVDCGPNKTTGIGTRTWCEVSWEYKGLPGSSLSLLPNGYGSQKTKMTSESEVVIK